MEAEMTDRRQDEQGSNSGGKGGEAPPRDPQESGDESASALGGGTATRSSTAEGPDPAEQKG
jgi:hypothetical protein